MHAVKLRDSIVRRVLERRGRLHLFDRLDPRKTALLVIDMQNAFVAPGAPVEVPAAPRCRRRGRSYRCHRATCR